MSSSFDLPRVDSFAAGTEGPAGQRIFYLQAVAGQQIVTLRLEKQQVALLADYLGRVLSSYELEPSEATVMPELRTAIPEWIVGSMMVAIDEAESRVIVIAEELLPDDEGDPDAPPDGSQARFGLTRGQVEAFIAGAEALMHAGRPTCPLCGRPIDPDGHFCPRLN